MFNLFQFRIRYQIIYAMEPATLKLYVKLYTTPILNLYELFSLFNDFKNHWSMICRTEKISLYIKNSNNYKVIYIKQKKINI